MQGTAEGTPFSKDTLDRLIELASDGIKRLVEIQKKTIKIEGNVLSF